jgi:hypothetical protein
MGGAFATMAAMEFHSWAPQSSVESYTFNSPRFGNALFASLLEKSLTEVVRWVQYDDLTTRLPPTQVGYRHGGKEIMFYDGGVKCCRESEDWACDYSSNSNFPTLDKQHVWLGKALLFGRTFCNIVANREYKAPTQKEMYFQ